MQIRIQFVWDVKAWFLNLKKKKKKKKKKNIMNLSSAEFAEKVVTGTTYLPRSVYLKICK